MAWAPTSSCASPSIGATSSGCSPRPSLPDVRGGWRIRAAQLGDREQLQALWRVIDQLHCEIVPSYFGRVVDRSDAAIRRTLGDPSERLLVAEQAESGVRGLAHVMLFDTPEGGGRRRVRRAHLDTLVVQAEFRRRGCARALLEASQKWARERGAEQLVLTVWTGNQAAAGLYQSMGFSLVSQVLGAKL